MASVVMHPAHRIEVIKGMVPLIIGSIVFVAIGAYMMKSGKK